MPPAVPVPIGERFARAVVLGEAPRNRFNQRQMRCRCDCGNEFVTGLHRLRYGSVKSCGCAQKEAARRNWQKAAEASRKPPGTSSRNEVLKQYRQDAKRRGHEFTLTAKQATALLVQPCHYCGSPPNRENVTPSGDRFTYSGLDRKDNNKGYTLANTVPCCNICNLGKRDRSYDEFLTWLFQVATRDSEAFRRASN